MPDRPGDLLATVQASIGWDVENLLRESEKIPDEILAIRQEMAPLRSELKALQEHYASKGRSPSHADIIRSTLLADLKEKVREEYAKCPDTKPHPKNPLRQVPIPITDGRAEDLAHQHPRYKEYVRMQNADYKRMAELGKQLAPKFDRIEAMKGKQRHIAQYLEMAKALVNAWNASTRLQ